MLSVASKLLQLVKLGTNLQTGFFDRLVATIKQTPKGSTRMLLLLPLLDSFMKYTDAESLNQLLLRSFCLEELLSEFSLRADLDSKILALLALIFQCRNGLTLFEQTHLGLPILLQRFKKADCGAYNLWIEVMISILASDPLTRVLLESEEFFTGMKMVFMTDKLFSKAKGLVSKQFEMVVSAISLINSICLKSSLFKVNLVEHQILGICVVTLILYLLNFL